MDFADHNPHKAEAMLAGAISDGDRAADYILDRAGCAVVDASLAGHSRSSAYR
jgi:hypothetical protein